MKLYESLATESVKQLAIREPVLCRPEEAVSSAIQKMRAKKLGCVIVVDPGGKPVGMFTEGMLTQMLVNDPSGIKDPLAARMSQQCPIVKETDLVSKVLKSMQLENTRFLGVVDASGRVTGLTGQKGLMEYVADHFPQQVMVQRVGSRPPQDREGA